MLWEYIKAVSVAAWDSAWGGDELIEILICFFLFLIPKIPKILEKIEKKGLARNEKSLRKIFIYKFLTNDWWRGGLIFLGFLILNILVLAPYQVYNGIAPENNRLKAELNDKSPKLNGFINRYLIAQEPGTTNSLIFLEVTIGNDGGSATAVTDYAMRVNLATNVLENAEEIYFTNEYTMNFWDRGRLYAMDLKRPELISERTVNEIPEHGIQRGWVAYRLNGIPMSKYDPTNIVLSFFDCHDKRTYVTNGIRIGNPATNEVKDAVAMILPGSAEIFYPVNMSTAPINTSTNWLPPELPNDCSNVTIFFGSSGMRYTRLVAEISPEKNNSTEFEVKDLPDFMLSGLNKTPGYSPRRKNIWYNWDIANDYGNTRVSLPVMPFIVSNRLFADVEVPFLNERRKVFMSEQFTSALTNIPNDWDWNYSTNYDANGGVFACELVNEWTNPVLQVFYMAPNTICVNGVFVIATNKVLWAFNCPPQLSTMGSIKFLNLTNSEEITNIAMYLGTNTLGEIMTNDLYSIKYPGQMTIFKYPSNRHLGDFQDWFVEMNKSDTKTFDKGK